MSAARRIHKTRQDAARLRSKTDIKRQIEEKRSHSGWNSQQKDVCESLPVPAGFMDPSQGVTANDQRRAEQNIPGIEEGQSPQHQRDGEETGLIDLQLAEEQVNAPAPASEEDIQRHGKGQQIKWHG